MSKCKNCGAELVQQPGKRKKEYCNSTCRSNKWQKKARKKDKKESGGLPLPKDFKQFKKLSAVDKNGKVVIKDVAKAAKKSLAAQAKIIESFVDSITPPKTLKELKEMVPAGLVGLNRSAWIAEARKQFGV